MIGIALLAALVAAPSATPEVTLVDAAGAPAPLAEALDHSGPVLLQFIFTTCTTICPVMTAVFAAAQDRLPGVRMISISIDPEHDTPPKLAAYAKRFGAREDWRFLTGRLEDVVAVEKAFGAYRGEKSRHEPLTLLRRSAGEPWERIARMMSARELVDLVYGPGRSIYREGATLEAEVNGATLRGAQAACANCHRRSGFGSSEGGIWVPPLVAGALDVPRKLYQEDQPADVRARLRSRSLAPRVAYTAEALGTLLREGRDPSGRLMSPIMPRYRLEDAAVRALADYLGSLSVAPLPREVHFATVVTEGVAPEKERAMLDVFRAYFKQKNAHAARKWTLHVWRLEGAPSAWRDQLEGEPPVLAILGGLGAGTWQPVHDYCEQHEVPCLFPQTPLPGESVPNSHTIYFSAGLLGEARALAQRLDRSAPVLQIYRPGTLGEAPARELRRLIAVEDHPLSSGTAFARGRVVVLWLDAEDVATLRPELGEARQIVLSSSLLGETQPVPKDRVLLTWPYALPGSAAPHAARVHAWLRARGVKRAWDRIQLNTHFVLSLADNCLDAIGDHFSADALIEQVEHETEAEAIPTNGVYPRLSLGPGQRFASKGIYLLTPSGSDWIVP